LKDNKNKFSRPNTKTPSLLSGLIACPICGKNLYTHKDSRRFEENGEPRFLYRCSLRKDESGACTYKPIRGNSLDKFILDTLCKIGNTNSDEYYKALEEEIKQSSFNVLNEETEQMKKAVKKLRADIEAQTQNLRSATDTTRNFILSDIEKLSEELKAKESQLNLLEENKENSVITLNGLNKARELINSFESLIDAMTYEEKLELVRLIIAKVYVINKDYITDENGNKVSNDKVHIFLKGAPEEDYKKFFKNTNPIKQDLQQNNENIKAQPHSKGVELLFCRNSDNMLMPLIHIIVPIKELSENPTIGEKIKFYRFKNSLTQSDLADVLDIDVETLSKYENNKAYPSLVLVNSMSKIFNIPCEFLYDDYYNFINYPYFEKVKEIRKKSNITQQQFADSLNISRETVKRWEKAVRVVSKEYYDRIKDFYLKQ